MPRSLPLDVSDPGFFAEVRRVQAEVLAEEAAESKAAFHLRMRGRGVQDRAVLRAFELVPRQTFVADRYAEPAARDLALPIGCGQTLDEPWLIGRMIEALQLDPAHRVLQIGAGTGYATAILSHLAAEVVGLERYQSLANAAQMRLDSLDIANARIAWADGLAAASDSGRFDRILVHGLLIELPASLMDQLADPGVIVCARPTDFGQTATQIAQSNGCLTEMHLCPCRMLPIRRGLPSLL